jgi:formate-dependent nitrite reductase cytochrome c552 subunit
MPVKTCTRCGKTKPLDQFPPRRRGEPRLQGWYQRNRSRTIAAVGQRNISRRTQARSRAGAVRRECVDCGETNPLLIDFDHLWDKRADVSYMIHAGFSWTRIEAEIDKCEVRCANCHALKTAHEVGNYKTNVG